MNLTKKDYRRIEDMMLTEDFEDVLSDLSCMFYSLAIQNHKISDDAVLEGIKCLCIYQLVLMSKIYVKHQELFRDIIQYIQSEESEIGNS